MKEKRVLLLIIVVALLVKIAFFLWGGVEPFQGADSYSFYSLALSVSKGEGLRYVDNGAPDIVLRSFRPPLYPLVTGGLFRVFGAHATGALLAQMVLGTLALGMMYALAKLLFDTRVARWAAFLTAVYWTSTFFENQIYSETLFVFLFLAANYVAFAAALREGEGMDWRPSVAGLFYGLAILCRPSAAAAVPLIVLWILWVRRRGGTRAVVVPSTVLVFTVLVLVPWWIRNYAVHGAFLPLVSSGGLNFWAGNQVTGEGDALLSAWSIMKENPDRLTEIGLNRWFYHDATEAIRSNPSHFVVMLKQKALWYWWPLHDSFYQLPYRLLFVFFLLGVGVSLKNLGRSLGLHAVLLTQFFVSVAYAAHSRYRYSIDFYIVLLAAVGLVALLRFAPLGRLWVGTALVLFVLTAGALGWIFHPQLIGLVRVWMIVPIGAALVLSGWAFLPERARGAPDQLPS